MMNCIKEFHHANEKNAIFGMRELATGYFRIHMDLNEYEISLHKQAHMLKQKIIRMGIESTRR